MNLNWNRFDYKINIDFFTNWSSQMAYILGFTFADGNIFKTTLAWDLRDDKELLEKMNKAMDSTYPIHARKNSWRLRISNPAIIEDLEKLGVTPNKSKTLCFPKKIPEDFLPHFFRGILDGDGWICIRKNRNEISVGFSSGSKIFLREFVKRLSQQLNLSKSDLRIRNKTTTKGIKTVTYQADYFCENANKVLLYLYSDIRETDLYMERKYSKFKEAVELYEWIKSGGRKWRTLEKKLGPMRETLFKFWKAGYNGPQIANKLGVHHSSIYRWLIRTGVRPAFTEIRRKGIANAG